MKHEGHPLPASQEARRSQVPEPAEQRKGDGDDERTAVQATEPVNPDGEPYQAGDLGRGATQQE
jgi:hypothetical protein